LTGWCEPKTVMLVTKQGVLLAYWKVLLFCLNTAWLQMVFSVV